MNHSEPCPNCGVVLDIVVFLKKPKRLPKEYAKGKTFQSTQKFKLGWLGSFWEQVIWNKRPTLFQDYQTRNDNRIVTIHSRSEDGRHIILQDIDERLPLDKLKELAQMIVEKEINWTGWNIQQNTSLSAYSVSILKKEFDSLNFTETSAANRTKVTPRGMRFLRNVLRS